MNSEKLLEYLKSPEGIASMERFAEKLAKQKTIESVYEERIMNYIVSLSDEQLNESMNAFLEWEKNYEEGAYTRRHMMTTSRIFNRVCDSFEKLSNGNKEEVNDSDFLGDTFTYRGYRFELYVGQGSFWRIYRNNEQIFQTT